MTGPAQQPRPPPLGRTQPALRRGDVFRIRGLGAYK